MMWKAFFALGVMILATAPANAAPASAGCLPSGNGYLRARVGGALNLELDWPNTGLECDGSLRPDGSGIRLSFAGPLHSDGRRVRMVFGISTATEGKAGHKLPTNLTVMFEGEQRLFATRGDDRCTIEELSQERIGALGGNSRSYRVIGRGFCVAPASTLAGDEQIIVSRFDFAGRATFEDDAADLSTFPRAKLEIHSGAERHEFDIWVADTPERQTQGLMFVRDLPPNQGMLFVQREPRNISMWMKNTFIPLDMLFIDPRGQVVKIAANTEPHSLNTISSGAPVMAVLELKGGEAARRHIGQGDVISWTDGNPGSR
jgi:uncharacterized membrane protein (UPF0127 family)